MKPQIPKVVRAMRWKFLVPAIVAGIGATLPLAVGPWSIPQMGASFGIAPMLAYAGIVTLGLWVCADVLQGFWAYREARLKRRANAMDNAVCCACGYSLVGHTDEPRCPECGWQYVDLEQVRKAWHAWQPKRGPRWVAGFRSLIARLTR